MPKGMVRYGVGLPGIAHLSTAIPVSSMNLRGPTIRGPGSFALRESEGPIRGELWPKLYNAEHKNNFWEAAEDSLVLGRSIIPPE